MDNQDREVAVWVLLTCTGFSFFIMWIVKKVQDTELAIAREYSDAAVEVAKVIMGGF